MLTTLNRLNQYNQTRSNETTIQIFDNSLHRDQRGTKRDPG